MEGVVLIVDDDVAIQASMVLLLKQGGYSVFYASDPSEGLGIINNQLPDVILLDLNYGNETSGEEGLEFLSQIKKRMPSVPVILMTAWGSIALAVKGMKLGAFDFISKPWDNQSLLKLVNTAIELNKDLPGEKKIKRQELDKEYNFKGIIGESPAFLNILETVARVSKTDAPVLILGESGSGKELIAEAIHDNSLRKDNPFVKVNLGGISTSLFESEMFGHKKGAFTDAYCDRSGRFETADSGTIFLDEIGDLDLNSQVKLLRVLQDKTYQVLGESTTRKTDVRIVCATNCDLKEMVKNGTFREDLFYRINLITIEMPSLFQRKDDIPLLVRYFLDGLKNAYKSEEIAIENEAVKWLKDQRFCGNIRELKNLVERVWLLSGKQILGLKDFKVVLEDVSSRPDKRFVPDPGTITIDEVEKEMILKAHQKYKGNVSKIAKSLGLSRGTLYRRYEKYGISNYRSNNDDE